MTAAGRCAIITLCSANRHDHLLNQRAAVEQLALGHPLEHIVVWLDLQLPPELPGATVLQVPPGALGLRLAAARNRGAACALASGATVLIFLDADCIPGPELVKRYLSAAEKHPGSLLGGPVTYLPEAFALPDPRDDAAAIWAAATRPHPSRPAPPPGETTVATDHQYVLFWSLSFALGADTWARLGGFHEDYEGYGGEDTDFGSAAQAASIPLIWVGGADAYHQHHPTAMPPWQHLDDIVRNAGLYFDRWGQWPMGGWLREFATAGAIRLVGGRWQRSRGDISAGSLSR